VVGLVLSRASVHRAVLPNTDTPVMSTGE
jgi:hypothetical protein